MTETATVRRLMVAIQRMEDTVQAQAQHARQAAELPQQAAAATVALDDARRHEEVLLRQGMAAMFADLQEKTEAAQRRSMVRTWQVLAALGAVFVVLYLGMLLLLKHEYTRLQDAQARADAAEVSAEVRRAWQHVEATSCGGRPCIRLDGDTPTWKSRGREYVLVDGSGT
ncbi:MULTISPECIES: hypothetical protein [unclassified Luteimonas]